jgi:nicotinate-nucleotide--dimethylbenzimidazole phosphoribosyltransferase
MSAFAAATVSVGELDADAERAAAAHHDRLTKPRGALGLLETIGIRLAAISGTMPPPIPTPAAVAVFAGDHGVLAQGVTPWPQAVTAQMVANFVAGGAAINVLARQMGASVTVIDVGVAAELDDAPGLLRRKVRTATADLAVEPAMTADDVERALDVGAEVAAELVDDGARALVTGDMGIGNTTAAAAIIAALTGRPAAAVTGRGTGIDDATFVRKVAVVERATTRLGANRDGRTVLAEVGGLEIAALAGFIVGGAARRVPVVVDGVIAGAALLVAANLCPRALAFAFAGHRSTEPGAAAVLEHVGLEPFLALGMRLGEGSGACLALPVLEASARVLAEMATFDSAGVSDKT